MFKRILIAIDGSPPAGKALEAGVSLAQDLHAEIVVAHVVDSAAAFRPELGVYDPGLLEQLRRDGQILLRESLEQIPRSIRAVQALLEGEPAETIVTAAKDLNADIIVLGSDSRGRLAHFLLGSTADSVIRRATCPVLTVRQQVESVRPTVAALHV